MQIAILMEIYHSQPELLIIVDKFQDNSSPNKTKEAQV